MNKRKNRAAHLISSVASTYDIHPQTLRLYERHGLLKPSRSEGNTRLYTAEDLERLEVILNLTRHLGVNLAGVEIILNMRAKMEAMEDEIRGFMNYVQSELRTKSGQGPSKNENALVRMTPPSIIRFSR